MSHAALPAYNAPWIAMFLTSKEAMHSIDRLWFHAVTHQRQWCDIETSLIHLPKLFDLTALRASSIVMAHSKLLA